MCRKAFPVQWMWLCWPLKVFIFVEYENPAIWLVQKGLDISRIRPLKTVILKTWLNDNFWQHRNKGVSSDLSHVCSVLLYFIFFNVPNKLKEKQIVVYLRVLSSHFYLSFVFSEILSKPYNKLLIDLACRYVLVKYCTSIFLHSPPVLLHT